MVLENLVEVEDEAKCRILIKEIWRLRFRVYSDIGLILPENFPGGQIRDEFDEIPQTVHFAVIEDGIVLGATRITEYSDEHDLPFDEDLSLEYYLKRLGKKKEDCMPAIYGSRLVVDKNATGKGIGRWLLAASHLYAADRGAKYAFGCKNPDFSVFDMVGWEAVGEEREHRLGDAKSDYLRSIPAVQDLVKFKDSRHALIAEEKSGYFFRGFPF